MEDGLAIQGSGEPHHSRRARAEQLLHARGRKVAAVPVVPGCLLLGRLFLAQRIQALLGAEAPVRLPFAHQPVRGSPVEVAPLRLYVGGVRAAHVRSLVPVDAQPGEGAVDALQGARRGALLVGVLDPQDERPAARAGGQIVIERGPDAADVK